MQRCLLEPFITIFLWPQQCGPHWMLCVCCWLYSPSLFALQILIYHPAFIKYVFDNWLQGHGRYPSTGILSVIFSIHICDEVCYPTFLQEQGLSPHVSREIRVGERGKDCFQTCLLMGSWHLSHQACVRVSTVWYHSQKQNFRLIPLKGG